MGELNKTLKDFDLPQVDAFQYNAIKEATKKKKRDTNMRTAIIRVSEENTVNEDYPELGLKKGDKVSYTKDDIVKILVDWSLTKHFKYYLIEHYEDPENKHIHIVIEFPKDSVCKWSTIKNKFPFGYIDRANNVKASVRYLWHADNDDKVKYSPDEVITNAPDRLESYKMPGKKTVNAKLQKILDMIVNGRIKECEIPTKIESDIYIRYTSKINNAFEYRRKILLNDSSRVINVVVFVGPPGVGKTTFVRAYAKKHNKTVYFSGSGADFMGDYHGEDILCLDDYNYDRLCIEDCLKLLDPYTNTTIKSRYHNRVFMGDTIFILTNLDICEFYNKDDDSLRMAFYRRISDVFVFEDLSDDYVVKYTIKRIVPTDDWGTVINYKGFEDYKYRKMELLPKYDKNSTFEFDLKKYIDFDSGKKQNEKFLNQLIEM